MIWSAILIYGILLLIAVFLSERMIFPYRGCSYGTAIEGLSFLRADDGTEIATRLWPADDDRLGILVLYFHGNYEDLGHLDPIAARLNEEDFSVLSMDYRGYGLSGGGHPTERACYEDAVMVYEEAKRLGYSPDRIVVWGRSVGSGPAVYLASRVETRALVLESAFSSAFRVACRIPLLPFDRFNNRKRISGVEAPLFVLHGDQDRIIPAWHSAILYNRHPGPKFRRVIPGAGHNNLWAFALNEELAALQRLLNATDLRQRSSASPSRQG